MSNDAVLLNAYPHPMVKLGCDRWGRTGQYPKGNLIVKFWSDIPLPSLLTKLANGKPHGRFQGEARTMSI